MKKIVQQNILFFTLFGIYLLLGLIVLISTTKTESFLWVNEYHCPFFDKLFFYWTSLGNGFIYFALLNIMLFFSSYKNALMILVAAGIQTIITSSCKEFFFEDAYRPMKFLAEINDQLHFVEGVKVHKYHSFPSGHTATAFTIFSLIVFFLNKKWIALIAFLLATGVAYSRIYIVQHFVVDVYFGAIAGVFSAMFVYWLFVTKKPGKERTSNWYDKAILRKYF